MEFLGTWLVTSIATFAAIALVPGLSAVGGSYMGPIMCALALALSTPSSSRSSSCSRCPSPSSRWERHRELARALVGRASARSTCWRPRRLADLVEARGPARLERVKHLVDHPLALVERDARGPTGNGLVEHHAVGLQLSASSTPVRSTCQVVGSC